jgi:hypothetical protein
MDVSNVGQRLWVGPKSVKVESRRGFFIGLVTILPVLDRSTNGGNANGGIKPKEIRLDSEPGDDALADGGQQRCVTKLFPGMDVGQVDFDRGNGDPGNRVPESNRGVGEAAGVDDDRGDLISGGVDPVDQFAFAVALAKVGFHAQDDGPLPDHRFNVGQCRVPIDGGLAGA